MRRRALLLGAATLGAATLGFGGLLAACSKPRTVRTSVHGGVDFVELLAKKPDDTLPLVIAIHGRGGAPEHWIDGWMPFPGSAHFALPRGFARHEQGFSWFASPLDMKSETLAKDVAAAEERLWKAIAELAASRKVILAGYEQGATLSFVMAARHPDAIVHAFPVVGGCPDTLLPREKSRAAPVTAYHGTADELVAIQGARDAVDAWKREGNEATLREYAGIGHSPTDKMHADLWSDMEKALRGKA